MLSLPRSGSTLLRCGGAGTEKTIRIERRAVKAVAPLRTLAHCLLASPIRSMPLGQERRSSPHRQRGIANSEIDHGTSGREEPSANAGKPAPSAASRGFLRYVSLTDPFVYNGFATIHLDWPFETWSLSHSNI